MKIIVDKMPESVTKCKFHGYKSVADDGKYMCTITHKVCAMEENKTCRVCKPFGDVIRPYMF